MPEGLSELLERLRLPHAYRASINSITNIYNWVQERMWPVYTTGIFISVLCMLASAQEKQILADNLFGKHSEIQEPEKREILLSNAQKLFHEEATQGVKQVVWMLPAGEFRREYGERHGSKV